MNRISQSLMKDYILYLSGEGCGEIFRQKYITRELETEPTKAMQLGNYFEYIATGYYNKKRGKPEPDLLKSGPNKGKPSTDYARAERQADRFKETLKELDLQVLKAGERIEIELEEGVTLSGVLDVRAKCIGPKGKALGLQPGEQIVIDTKYSGLLGNKWEEGGWHPDSIQYRHHHHIQPAQYVLMTGLRFFYFVYGTTPLESATIFEIVIPPTAVEFHKRRALNVSHKLEIETQIGGFRHRPTFDRCRTCPLVESCTHAAKIPDYHRVEVLPEYNQHLDE